MNQLKAWHAEIMNPVEADDGDALAERLASDVEKKLNEAIAERGVASLMVSGGSTPVPFFKALQNREIEWSKVTVGLVDERVVPPSHADSNERLVREHLLQGKAAAARFIGISESESLGSEDLVRCENALAKLLEQHAGHFDVVILGMGGDGHTASLFPVHDGNREELTRALEPEEPPRLCCQMMPAEAPHLRISLTLDAICRSRLLVLHITGDEKRAVLDDALEKGDVLQKPVCSVFKRANPVVYWSA